MVFTTTLAVGRNHHRLKTVDFLEFVGFCVRCTRHSRQFAIQTKVVLEGDGCHRLVLSLDSNSFLGLHRLVQTIAPAAPRHQPPGKLIDDDDFALLHDIVLVTVIQMVGTQRCIEVVHQGDVGRVVKGRTWRNQPHLGKNALRRFVPLFGQKDLVAFFIHRKVARLGNTFTGPGICLALLALQLGCGLVDGHVHVGVVFRLTADDQGCTSLINQNRVHLVHDGIVQTTLDPVSHLVHHVVTQVIEAILVVRPVRNVGPVGGLFILARRLWQVDAHGKAEKVVEPTHPLRITTGQIVVDGHHVNAATRQCIKVYR